MSKRTYTPRNSFVLCRLVARGTTDGGLVIPESDKGGKDVFIEKVGEDVKGLKEGDQVMVVGNAGEVNCYPLPLDSTLFVVKEEFVALVVNKEE